MACGYEVKHALPESGNLRRTTLEEGATVRRRFALPARWNCAADIDLAKIGVGIYSRRATLTDTAVQDGDRDLNFASLNRRSKSVAPPAPKNRLADN